MTEDRDGDHQTEPSDASTYEKFRALARKLFGVPKSEIPARPKRPASKKLKPEGS